MNPIRVLIADEHTLVRAGIRSLLEDLDGIRVVAEASDGRTTLSLAELHRPDVVLMDIAMKELNGLETTQQLKHEYPEIRIVILSMYASEEYVLQALRAGASAYLLKDSATTELELALRAVMRDETYLSPAVSKQVVDSYVQRVGSGLKPLDLLTARQREILRFIVEGHGTKEIAYRLQLSVKTVESHRAQLMERLNIHDIPGLVRYAARVGLVKMDS